MTRPTSRRTVLTAALAAGAGAVSAAGSAAAAPARTSPTPAVTSLVDNRFWNTYTDWRFGSSEGTRAVAGRRPGLVISAPAGTTDYADPHTGRTTTWEYATWTSPVHRSTVPATEVIASWNARTPAGTWIQIELRGRYLAFHYWFYQ